MSAKKFSPVLVLLFCLLPLAAGTVGQQGTATAPASKLVDVKVPAPSLKDNVLGQPTELDASIYLPPSYASSATKRYPTIYLLHGFLSTDDAWIKGGYQGMNIQTTMDQLMSAGKIGEMIVVLPNGRNSYGGAFYTNSSVTGNWEDYIYRDLVQFIDANYRTIAASESRGIAGHSMGGYGALVLGMKHPDIFGAVYALSPCCTALEADMGETNPAWLKVLRLSSKDQLKSKPESIEDFFVIAYVALSAAFSPNPARPPFHVDFPFKERASSGSAPTAGLEKDAAYTRWRARMPAYMVEENQQNLRKLRGIFIDYGEKEEFAHIVIGAQQLSMALGERRIPHTLEVYANGDHGSKIRERVETRMLPFFAQKLAGVTP